MPVIVLALALGEVMPIGVSPNSAYLAKLKCETLIAANTVKSAFEAALDCALAGPPA